MWLATLIIAVLGSYHLIHWSEFASTAAVADVPATTITTAGPIGTATAAPAASAPHATFGPVDCQADACVGLTFDDGPSPYTGQLLDVLAERHVDATFFVLGASVQRYPDALRRAVAEGQEIGNHTWSHHDLTKLTPDQIREEIDRTADLVQQVAGVRPALVRPPFGARNATVDQVLAAPEILWNVDPKDWEGTDGQALVDAVVQNSKSGSIILLHDIEHSSVETLPAILDGLAAKGLTPVSISELFAGRTLEPGHAYGWRSANVDAAN